RETDVRLKAWMESRSSFLETNANGDLFNNGQPSTKFGAKVFAEFDQITVLKSGLRNTWSASTGRDTTDEILAAYNKNVRRKQGSIQLVALPSRDTRNGVYFALVVPLALNEQSGMIIARLNRKTLHDLVEAPRSHSEGSLFLFRANEIAMPLTHVAPDVRRLVNSMTQSDMQTTSSTTVLLMKVDSGKALMSDLRDAQITRSAALSAFPDWQILAVAPLQPV
ncbi:MAG: hypothetical protein ACK4ZE_13915, partial [Sphingorhabdus sp.]